ncbi:hypothetical protein CCHL11_01976 [Colletotrichum chlorophyti]|uniref:Uncharacterized protein n=1 Tax=Colletotrichum chlorophyti TaxID=708187 RepID=A0A1Q8RVM9_9PEZI|nr:hypothetical protein CCHL11_01976 [Colletotrichum chlorophyti]
MTSSKPRKLKLGPLGPRSANINRQPGSSAPNGPLSPKKTETQNVSKRRHRPSDILIFPPRPPRPSITITRLGREAELLPSPRLARMQNHRSVALAKRPRILLSTKTFKWVKTGGDSGTWTKKRRILLKLEDRQ